MTTIVAAATAAGGIRAPFRIGMPLTERMLDRLPGPRVAWFLAWGLLPFAAPEIAYRAWQLPTYQGLVSNLAIGFVNLFGLWAAGRLSRRVEGLEPTLERLLPAEELGAHRHPFRRVGSIVGPLLVTALLVLSWEGIDFISFPGVATGFVLATVFLGEVAVCTFLWVYAVALFGLDRIGRRRLSLAAFATDPHLGLKPLGSLAFEAYLLFGLMVAPALALFLTDVRGTVGTLSVVAVVSALFVLSAYSLHRKLAEAKSGHVRWARELVAAALRPIPGDDPDPANAPATVEAMARARPALATATEIERRALAIAEWPFDATIVRAVAAIVTSVTAVVIARLLLSRLGM